MSAADSARRWNALTSLATLGTNRAAPSVGQLIADAGAPIPNGPVEPTLLRAAAVSDLWQLAGTRAGAAAPPTADVAPEANERVASENAAWRLARMLNGEHRYLVPEWLRLASRANVVIPPHWLPVALDNLTTAERSSAGAVLGSRALWLTKRNPAWSFTMVSAQPSVERWMNGTLAERSAELTAARRADPALALDWLSRTWSTEPPEARVQFMNVLLNAAGLSGRDEAFLEAALDDKRKDVRLLAAACLCYLPESAHARRNANRLEPLIAMSAARSGLLGKLRARQLELTLPESLDKTALRDGIEPKPPAQRKIGERAWWLVQMVAMMRPSWWCERFDCDVETFLGAVQETDYATDLLLALAEAASRNQDVAWISALARRLVKWSGPQELQPGVHQAFAALLASAPASDREAVLEPILASLDQSQFDLVLLLLDALDVEWGAGSTRRAFELLDKRVRDDSQTYSYARNVLTSWGSHADVTVASAALARTIERCPDKSPWRNALDTLNEMLEFRTAMRRELLT